MRVYIKQCLWFKLTVELIASMGDFFGGLRSGIQFPQVVMNQGPLPGAGGLPAPLHDTADARINYGSSLLGDLTPYAYGEPGYLSSQNAYLNIPHKIQKIVPVVYLPEAKVGAKEFFDLSHPVDDGDIAFVLRLDRSSVFCTGLRNADMRRAGLGTAVDPLINLCTLNYMLSGLQLGIGADDQAGHGNLWTELFYNLDKQRFGKPTGMDSRNYSTAPIGLDDVMHVIRHCVKPFGITRGSEKQGGQDEATISPATWPVSFVVSLTIDGKESNVLNIWHYHELHAGNDLVLRLKLMPLRPYTLNHYYKGVKRQNWHMPNKFVWQLVPDIFHLDAPSKTEILETRQIFEQLDYAVYRNGERYQPLRLARFFVNMDQKPVSSKFEQIESDQCWQELGYWHIGRSQIMTGKYGVEEYWHNDLANLLRTNHLDITFQPSFVQLSGLQELEPGRPLPHRMEQNIGLLESKTSDKIKPWAATLQLERLGGEQGAAASNIRNQRRRFNHSGRPEQAVGSDAAESLMMPVPSLAVVHEDRPPVVEQDSREIHEGEGRMEAAPSLEEARPAIPAGGEEPEWLGRLEFTDSEPAPGNTDPLVPALGTSMQASGNKKVSAKAAGKRGRSIGGSLLKADGTSEASMVGML